MRAMQITHNQTNVAKFDADAVVVGVFENTPPSGPAAEVDRASGGLVSRLIEGKEFAGKPYELLPLLSPPGIASRQVLLIGLGPREKFDAGGAFRSAAAAARQLAAKPRGK